MTEYPIIDCRAYQGNNSPYSAGRIVSVDTCNHALRALKKRAEAGDYKMLYADDAGALLEAIKELERAVAEVSPKG